MNRLSPTPGPRGTQAATRLLALLLLHLALLLAPARAATTDPAAGCAMPATSMDRMDQAGGMHAEIAPRAMVAAMVAAMAAHSGTPHLGPHPCCPPHAACRHDGACLQPGHCAAAWLVPAPPVRLHHAPVVPAAFAPPRPSERDGLAHAPSIPPPRPPV